MNTGGAVAVRSGGAQSADGVWRSAIGGRSIARTATSIRAASLRTESLVRPRRLAALANPLAALRAAAPSLDVLAESAALSSPGTDDATTRRSSARRPAPVRGSLGPSSSAVLAASDGPRTRPSLSSDPGPGPAAGVVGSAAARSAAARSTTARPRPQPDPPTGSEQRPTLAAGQRNGADAHHPAGAPGPRGGHVGGPGSPIHPSLALSANESAAAAGPTPGRMGTAALAAAAGIDGRPRVAAHGTDSAARGADPLVAGGPATPLTSRPAADAHRGGAPAVPVNHVGSDAGALGELLGRWQAPGAASDPAVPAPPLPGPSWSTPVMSSRAAFADLAPVSTVPEFSMDVVQLALSELLRREAEQFGLEGGPG